jgi:urease accessory protein
MLAEIFTANRSAGRIVLAVKAQGGATRRAHLFEDGPLRVRFPGAPAREAQAVIINTAGGIAGGDTHEIRVSAGERTALTVTSAAAEKVYRTLGPASEITASLAVAAGGSLAWMPQETILFDGAHLTRAIDVELAPDARLLLAEAVIFGRAAMQERVTQGQLVDRWRVRRAGQLIYADTMRLGDGITDQLALPAVAAGGIAVASVLLAPGDDATVEAVRARGQDCRGEFGISAWNGIALARLCAPDGATLRHDLTLVLQTLRGTALPRLWVG